MTIVKHTWYPGRPTVVLADALTAVLQDYDTGGVAEEALGVARQNSKAIGDLVALLTERGVLTPKEALEVCGADYKYEVVHAPADGA